MVNLSEKRELVIKLFILVVTLLLSLAIYLHGKDLNCDQCIINFKNTQVSGQVMSMPEFKVKLIDFYNEYQKSESCMVIWDRVQGFQGGNLNELD